MKGEPTALVASGSRGVACVMASHYLTLLDLEDDDEEEEEEEDDDDEDEDEEEEDQQHDEDDDVAEMKDADEVEQEASEVSSDVSGQIQT